MLTQSPPSLPYTGMSCLLGASHRPLLFFGDWGGCLLSFSRMLGVDVVGILVTEVERLSHDGDGWE